MSPHWWPWHPSPEVRARETRWSEGGLVARGRGLRRRGVPAAVAAPFRVRGPSRQVAPSRERALDADCLTPAGRRRRARHSAAVRLRGVGLPRLFVGRQSHTWGPLRLAAEMAP